MTYLIDTNVLLRSTDPESVQSQIASLAIRRLKRRNDVLVVASQNLVEFWSVATRPLAANGLGWSLARADRRIRYFEKLVELLPDSPAVFDRWRSVVLKYRIIGSLSFDARLAAAMLVYDISHILTFNTADFARYAPEGIVAVDPAAI